MATTTTVVEPTRSATEAAELAVRLAKLSGSELMALADRVRRELGSVEGEIAWWRATMGVERSLRCTRRSRAAGLASHDASAAVLRAAEAAGVRATDRDAVTLVARAASDVARALVAGTGSPRPPAAAVPAWREVLTAVALAA